MEPQVETPSFVRAEIRAEQMIKQSDVKSKTEESSAAGKVKSRYLSTKKGEVTCKHLLETVYVEVWPPPTWSRPWWLLKALDRKTFYLQLHFILECFMPKHILYCLQTPFSCLAGPILVRKTYALLVV